MRVKLINTVNWRGKIYRAGMTFSLPDDTLDVIEDGEDFENSESAPFIERMKTKSRELCHE